MRLLHAALLLAVSASPALAQREPEIVIPGKPGVPVYINGIDASWGVVEGEFGLSRPGLLAPTVIYRPQIEALPYNVPAYHPATGKKPGYGRYEIIPPPDRPKPPPAPTYYRSWSSGSAPGPVTDYAPYNGPAVVDSQFGGRWRHHGWGQGSGQGKGRGPGQGSGQGKGQGWGQGSGQGQGQGPGQGQGWGQGHKS